MGMLGEQILGHFKKFFLPKIELKLLEIEDIDTNIVKAMIQVLLFNPELSETTRFFNTSAHVKYWKWCATE